ncbi:YslB family protein [Halalkalibacter urbisdiaboli]|uniref:YslB family protein n=1 Tax=Halalkalibacter urbisdiaboli TaxID=1960589 RepID=UPI000B44C04D|nr:YslB family protein [Halalkalibacter urbisdiaboli]
MDLLERDAVHFGYDLIRNDLLKELLGQEHDSLLYWSGKALARKYPLHSITETIEFFKDANWGSLALIKEKKRERLFELRGTWMGKQDKRCYQLEAGFLAQQVEHLTGFTSGATNTVKKGFVLFHIETDVQDEIE